MTSEADRVAQFRLSLRGILEGMVQNLSPSLSTLPVRTEAAGISAHRNTSRCLLMHLKLYSQRVTVGFFWFKTSYRLPVRFVHGRKTERGILAKYFGNLTHRSIYCFSIHDQNELGSLTGSTRFRIATLPLQEHLWEYWDFFPRGGGVYTGKWYFRAELIWGKREAKCGWLATLHREPWTAAAGLATFCWSPYQSIPCWTVCPTRRWRLWCWGQATSGKPVWGIHRCISEGGKMKKFKWIWDDFTRKFNSCLAGILLDFSVRITADWHTHHADFRC